MLSVEDQRGVHGPHPALRGGAPVEQVQEMRADTVVVGLDFDASAVVRVVEPVQEHGAKAGHETVGDIAGVRHIVVKRLGKHAPQRRDPGAHHIHRMGRRGNGFEHLLHALRQPAQPAQLGLVCDQLRWRRKVAMHQEVGDFLELGGLGELENVIPAIMQVVARPAHGAQCGVPGGHAGESDRLLGLESDFAHRILLPSGKRAGAERATDRFLGFNWPASAFLRSCR